MQLTIEIASKEIHKQIWMHMKKLDFTLKELQIIEKLLYHNILKFKRNKRDGIQTEWVQFFSNKIQLISHIWKDNEP